MMASTRWRFSYQKLRKKPLELEEAGTAETGEGEEEEEKLEQVLRSSKAWLRLRSSSSSSRSRRWRRPRVRIPGLRRLLRRKTRLVRASLGRVLKRLKESRAHFGDLFAGNYMFMQVSPSPLGFTLEKSSLKEGGDGRALPTVPSRYYLDRVV